MVLSSNLTKVASLRFMEYAVLMVNLPRIITIAALTHAGAVGSPVIAPAAGRAVEEYRKGSWFTAIQLY